MRDAITAGRDAVAANNRVGCRIATLGVGNGVIAPDHPAAVTIAACGAGSMNAAGGVSATVGISTGTGADTATTSGTPASRRSDAGQIERGDLSRTQAGLRPDVRARSLCPRKRLLVLQRLSYTQGFELVCNHFNYKYVIEQKDGRSNRGRGIDQRSRHSVSPA